MFFLVISFSTELVAMDPVDEGFNCWYSSSPYYEIYYSVIGGEEGVTYTVTGVAAGAIELAEAPPNLTGPSDTNSVVIKCRSDGDGKVKLTFKKGAQVLQSCTLCFHCTGVNQPPSEIGCEVTFPTLSEWVLIVLALSVGGFFVWQLKRGRKAVASYQ
jgi:hypothetical protein